MAREKSKRVKVRRENLNRAIKIAGSSSKLVKMCDISASEISQFMNPDHPRNIGDIAAEKIENGLGLGFGWMDQIHESEVDEIADKSQARDSVAKEPIGKYFAETITPGVDLTESNAVPIVGTAEGGPNGHWDELGYPVGDGEEYVEAYSKDKNAYSLLVSGNSMAPRMRPGEAILVEPNHEPSPGDEVVIRTTDDQVMVKIFTQRNGNRIMLDSISDAHDQIMLTVDQIVIMHYVAGVFRSSSIKQRNPSQHFSYE